MSANLLNSTVPLDDGASAEQKAIAQDIHDAFVHGGWSAVDDIREALGYADGTLPPRSLDTEFRIYTAEEYMKRPPIGFLDGHGLIQANGMTMLVGQPGAGKSLWAIRKLNEIAETSPTLFVPAEARAGLPNRLSAYAQHYQTDIKFDILEGPLNLCDPESVRQFIEACRPHKYVVIGFDTWAALTPGLEENASGGNTLVLEQVRRIMSELGCAVLLVHHTTKDGNSYRGSSTIEAAVDVMLMLALKDGVITLTAFKTRETDKPTPEYYRIIGLEGRPDVNTGKSAIAPVMVEHQLVPVKSVQTLTADQQLILEVLESDPLGLPFGKVASALPNGETSLLSRLTSLKALGLVTQAPDSNYSITPAGHNALHGVDT